MEHSSVNSCVAAAKRFWVAELRRSADEHLPVSERAGQDWAGLGSRSAGRAGGSCPVSAYEPKYGSGTRTAEELVGLLYIGDGLVTGGPGPQGTGPDLYIGTLRMVPRSTGW